MLLVSLETEISNREMDIAFIIVLETIPVREHVEGSHSESQPHAEI